MKNARFKCQLVIVVLACTNLVWADSIGDPDLLGCWRSDVGTSYLADGTTREAKGKCTLEFTRDQILSRCKGKKGASDITYKYRVIEFGIYEAEISEHASLPSASGSKRLYKYHIDQDSLFITTYPQTTTPAPLNAAIKFVSKLLRIKNLCDP